MNPPEQQKISEAVAKWDENCPTYLKMRHKRVAISHLVKSLPQTVQNVHQIDETHIENFVSGLLREYGSDTIKTYVYVTRVFLQWLSKEYGTALISIKMSLRLHKTNELPVLKVEGNPDCNVVDEWYLDIQHLAPETQSIYKRILSNFFSTIPDKTIDKLTPSDIRAYLLKAAASRTKSSLNNHIVALKNFGRFIAENYRIDNPAASIKKFKPEPSIGRFLTHEEYTKLLSACKRDRETHIFILLGNTGLRASEACALSWDSVAPNFTRITVIGKGRKIRTIPLNENCRKVLMKYPREPAAHITIFPKNRHVLGQICHRVGKRANIPCNPHALRHYFATELLRRGIKIAFVSKILGHSSIGITEQYYIHWQPDYLNGMTDILDQDHREGVAL